MSQELRRRKPQPNSGEQKHEAGVHTGVHLDDEHDAIPEALGCIGKIKAWVKEMYGVDLRALAVWRICVALVVLYDTYRRTGPLNNFLELRMWYSEKGVFPRSVASLRMAQDGLIVHLATASAFGQGMLFLGAAIAAGCLLVGYKTRIANVIVWLLFMGCQRRNPLIHQSGDTIMRHSLFWMIFLPVSECLSVDSGDRVGSTSRRCNRILTFPGAGILLQCGALYVFACCHKSYTAYVENRTVVADILQFEHYSSMEPGFLTEFLLKHNILLQLLSVKTFFIELSCGIIMLVPILYPQLSRFVAVVMTSCLQVGFMLSLNLGTFPFSSLALGIPGLPSFVWDYVFPASKTATQAASCEQKHKKNWIVEIVGALLILMMFVSNIQYLRAEGDLFIKNTIRLKMPSAIMPLHNFLGLKQIWNMFAFKANEPSVTGRFIVGGHLQSGQQVDLLTGSHWPKISFKKWSQQVEVSKVYPSFHHRAFALYLFGEYDEVLYSSYMRFLCYKHNQLEMKGTKFHNSPSNVTEKLEFIELWRITSHVHRYNETIDYDKFKSRERIFAWNCLKNRKFEEGDDQD